MKTIFIIETAEELLHIARKHRIAGDDSPSLNTKAKLVFENNMGNVRLEGDAGFQLSEHLENNPHAIISVMARHLNVDSHFT